MGKYEGIVKYLGKEDSFTPEQIKKGIESHEKMESLSDMSGISQQDMANVDKLINGSSGSATAGSSPVDADVLKELEGLDAEPPNIEELQSRLQVTNYETPTEELIQEMTTDEAPAEEEPSQEETPDINLLEPQFAQKKPEVQEEEIPLPPMLDESAPQQVSEGTGGMGDLSDMSDLLSQLKPTEQPALETPAPEVSQAAEVQIPETAFEMPETAPALQGEPQVSSEPDLSAMMGPFEETAPKTETVPEPEVQKAPEEFAFEMPKMEESIPSKTEDFELPPDFGMKEEAAPEISLPQTGPSESMKIDTSKLSLEDDNMPGMFGKGTETEPAPAKREGPRDEFMDIKDQFKEQKAKPTPPEILKPFKETRTSFGMDIDQDKAVKIRNKINKIVNPMLRKKVRYAFIEGKLPDDVLQQLIPMLLLGEEEYNIAELIDKYVPESVIKEKETPPAPAGAKPKRKVIHTEESLRVKDFQKDLQNITKYSFILVFVVILLGFLFWKVIWTPARAGYYYNQGINSIKLEDYKNAEAKFLAGKSISGPDNKWYNKFAKAYEGKKEFIAAKKKYTEALENKPLDKETIFNYANYFTIIYPPRYEDAVKLYERLLKKEPNRFEYIDRTAQLYVLWGDRTSTVTSEGAADQMSHYDQATSLYQNYLMKNPKHVGSYYQLLDIELRLTNSEKIDQYYDTIDQFNRQAVSVPILTKLGRYYTDNRRLDRAKKVFEKLMAANPQLDESHYEYARYLTINYDYIRAIFEVSNAIRLNDKMGKAYNLLGEILYINDTIPNNIILAKAQFEEAERYSPNYYKPLANLGHIYFFNNLSFADPQEKLKLAFDYYKKAYINYSTYKEKKDDLLVYNLGWLYYYEKGFDEALDLFMKLYIEEPYNPVLSYALGNTYYNMYLQSRNRDVNKLNLAKAEYDKAIEYYQAIANKISYINANLERHREVYGQLARCYNNRGVIYASYAKQDRKGEYEEKALLDFYKSKDNANRINSVYTFSEYNIKYILNKNIKGKKPAFDDELLKRTTLQKLIEELRQKMVNTL